MDRCTYYDNEIRCSNTTKNKNKLCGCHSSFPRLKKGVMRSCQGCTRLYYKLRWFKCSHGYCEVCISHLDKFDCPYCSKRIYNDLTESQKRKVLVNQLTNHPYVRLKMLGSDVLILYKELEDLRNDFLEGYNRSEEVHHNLVRSLRWENCVREATESVSDILLCTDTLGIRSGDLVIEFRLIHSFHPLLMRSFRDFSIEPSLGHRIGVYLMAIDHNVVTWYPSFPS